MMYSRFLRRSASRCGISLSISANLIAWRSSPELPEGMYSDTTLMSL